MPIQATSTMGPVRVTLGAQPDTFANIDIWSRPATAATVAAATTARSSPPAT